MNNYRVTGEDREVGAIGIFEPFIENVVAESSLKAYEDARGQRYDNNREHVQIREIRLITDNYTVVIEPRAYL